MKISHKLIAILVVLCLFLLLMSSMGWMTFRAQHASLETIYKDRVIPLRDLKVIADAYAVSIIDLVNKTNAGLTTAEDALTEVDTASQLIEKKWQAYIATHLIPPEEKLANEAKQLFQAANKSIQELRTVLQGKKGLIPGELDNFDGELYKTIDPISNKITQLINLQLDIVDSEHNSSSARYEHISLLSTVGILTAILASIASFFVGSTIISQLSKLGTEPSDLAVAVKAIADGDLSSRVNEISAKEGSVARETNKMAEKLHSVILNVNHVSDHLKLTAEQLKKGSEKTLSDLDTQHQQIEQVATAMNEMTATIAEVARNAQGAAQSSLSADKQVNEGTQLVENSLTSIINLTNDVREAAAVITRLKTDSAEIGKILEVIRSIAEQTNLLALNAAIEAARAGEQGRGFAVVADEVRTLASKTHTSTQEIQEMIGRLQAGVTNAVQVIDKSLGNSQSTVSYAEKIRHALGEISTSVSEINNMNIQIATATEEQTMVAEEVNRNIININQFTAQTTVTVNQVEASSKQLSTYATELQKRISYFQV
ncbi:methyl-accepting chemotaxis protein [Cellvibrio mixtus]|uniref:methyl-accepting chemotaxis protein n=1 Tax=Cellvibrio mixtus TaxID=39650 RepID=UPI000587F9E4|nr:methyl-accepting chemotaxis protein [Cellvibrio mixtus]